MLLKIGSMIFFHKTAAFTHTMYFFRIQRIGIWQVEIWWVGIRQFGFWRNGRTPL